MKPTKATALIAYAVATAILGFGASTFLVRSGFALPLSPTNLLITLPVIAVVLVIMALPILRYRAAVKRAIEKPETAKLHPPKRVDPFFAMRVAILAKSVAISGSVFLGWHAGVLIALTRAPEIESGSVWRQVFGLLGSIALIVAGLIIENSCKIPPDATPPDAEASTA
jgi:hypothetical protein